MHSQIVEVSSKVSENVGNVSVSTLSTLSLFEIDLSKFLFVNKYLLQIIVAVQLLIQLYFLPCQFSVYLNGILYDSMHPRIIPFLTYLLWIFQLLNRQLSSCVHYFDGNAESIRANSTVGLQLRPRLHEIGSNFRRGVSKADPVCCARAFDSVC